MGQTKCMQEVESNRDIAEQEVLRSTASALEETDKVWKLVDER